MLFIRKYLQPISYCPLAVAIRRGLTLMIPLMIMGSFAIFINNLPITAYQHFMVRHFGADWVSLGNYIHSGSFAIMAVGMLLAISYSLAELSSAARQNKVNPVIAAIISLGCLFVFIPVDNGVIKIEWLGPLGVFIAIVVAGISTKVFLYFSGFSWLKIKVYSDVADPTISQALSALLPAIITIVLFAVLHVGMDLIGVNDIYVTINSLLSKVFADRSSNLGTAIIFIFMVHLCWFFGVHGNNVLEPVTQSLFVPALAHNQQLMAQGILPVDIFTKQFFDVFVFLGGSGATMCLIVALWLGTRRSNTKQIAVISSLPGLINVNEIMVFGVPIVFNLYLLLPFVLLPVLLTVITYLAMLWGLVPLTTASVAWTTPIILGGYKATGSIAGSILQAFNLVIGILVYLPFIRLSEHYMTRSNAKTMQNLLHIVNHKDRKREAVLLNRKDTAGNLARLLMTDLERDLHDEKIFLEYQPQVNSRQQIIGMEALLRWRHEKFGRVSPPIIIAIAEEAGLMEDLGIKVIKTACQQLQQWNEEGLSDLLMSINISPSQLDDTRLPSQIRAILLECDIRPDQVQLEVTEQVALGGLKRIKLIQEIKELGLRLAMDDFGMGHSSLMYLKEFNLDTIKIDGSLIREVLTNDKCREIISTIVQLGQSIGIEVVAEYVETEEQKLVLMEMGCLVYQGFLYSPALAPDEFVRFYHNHLN